jgi:hypothetical protein
MTRSNLHVLEFGIGKVFVAHGTMGGLPVVSIMENTNEAGIVGELCPEMKSKMEENSIVLRFHNLEGALNLLSSLEKVIIASKETP